LTITSVTSGSFSRNSIGPTPTTASEASFGIHGQLGDTEADSGTSYSLTRSASDGI
jgi:hypothetical protein